MALVPVYELEFYEFSFGFRPEKSPHLALEYLWKSIMDNNIQWIIDLDIRKFFDTVKHEILRQLLRKRVRDGVITRLIGKWLKAGVLESGSISYSDEGTPQGGVISPLLSNIYLHEALDKWYVEEIRPILEGRSVIVRFADDVILGYETRADAEMVLEAIKLRLEEYGLKLHPEKTRLVYLAKPENRNGRNNRRGKGSGPKSGTFDFLGFTHFWAKSFKGNWAIRRKTASQKFREKMRKINEWCRKNRHLPIAIQHEKICRKLKGHYGYYGITGNMRGMKRYLYEVTRTWLKWLRRRSWRGNRLNWDKFNILLADHFPLPQPKVVHSVFKVAQRIHNPRNRMR